MAQTKTSQGPRAEPVGRRVRLSVWCALPRTLGCLSNVSTFYFAHYMPFHGQSRGTVESEWSKVLSSYHGVWGSNGKGMGVGRGEKFLRFGYFWRSRGDRCSASSMPFMRRRARHNPNGDIRFIPCDLCCIIYKAFVYLRKGDETRHHKDNERYQLHGVAAAASAAWRPPRSFFLDSAGGGLRGAAAGEGGGCGRCGVALPAAAVREASS